nr:putative alpha 1B-glycoprotein [Rattus norvegicus]|eukprot:NP_071594.2 alpha-1B-glycoprotein precursor [Rattus norvegicus]
MSLLTTVLLLWGFTLGPGNALWLNSGSEPELRAEPQSLLEPWANLTLVCAVDLPTKVFELIMNGWFLSQVRLETPVLSYRFSLGAITSNNSGVYRCRCGVEPPVDIQLPALSKWTMLSNALEVTGKEPLPPPSAHADPVSWITPGGLPVYIMCRVAMRGVTYLLRKEGVDGTQKPDVQHKGTAGFLIYKPGNYSCSYLTHAGGEPSEPSAIVTIKMSATQLPPSLCLMGSYLTIYPQKTHETLACKAPRNAAEFQLRQGERVLNIQGFSPTRDATIYYVNLKELDNQSPFTCRYRMHKYMHVWSEDSKPVELMWSDEKLPAPVLTAEPSSHNLEPGSTVQLRCTAHKAGLRFGLQRQGKPDLVVVQMLNSSGTEAVFELHNISTIDSGNYSCIYMEQAPPFSGSASSEPLELRINGPAPKPRLEALWKGKVPLGHEAIFQCHGHVPRVSMELVREGFKTPFWMASTTSTSAFLKLSFVGPQHTGNYSCRYTALSPFTFESGISDPVEVVVEGS